MSCVVCGRWERDLDQILEVEKYAPSPSDKELALAQRIESFSNGKFLKMIAATNNILFSTDISAQEELVEQEEGLPEQEELSEQEEMVLKHSQIDQNDFSLDSFLSFGVFRFFDRGSQLEGCVCDSVTYRGRKISSVLDRCCFQI